MVLCMSQYGGTSPWTLPCAVCKLELITGQDMYDTLDNMRMSSVRTNFQGLGRSGSGGDGQGPGRTLHEGGEGDEPHQRVLGQLLQHVPHRAFQALR